MQPFRGTSAAAPHAAAIAALLLSYKPALALDEVRKVLKDCAIKIGSAPWDRNSGGGIIMAEAALQEAATLSHSKVTPPKSEGSSGGHQ